MSAFELWNGESVWSLQLAPEGIAAAPTFAYGRIYTLVTSMSTGAKAYSVDPDDGRILWEVAITQYSSWNSFGPPAAYRGLVMFPAEYRLIALDALTGAIEWSDPAAGSYA
jgi:outer membrane protein assembly factor BamB